MIVATVIFCRVILFFGDNSKHLYTHLTVTDVYNPLTARWHYLEEYLLVWIALGVIVATVIFWCVIRVFGDDSKY